MTVGWRTRQESKSRLELMLLLTTLDLPLLLFEMPEGSEKPSSQMLWNQDGWMSRRIGLCRLEEGWRG